MTSEQVVQNKGRAISDRAGQWVALAATQVRLKIADIMVEEVMTIEPMDTLGTAARKMADHRISCLVVTEAGVVKGILTAKDFLKKAATTQDGLYLRTVLEAMTYPVQCVGPGQTIVDASRVMESRGIRHLPVVDHGRLVGVVTQSDLTRALTSCHALQDIAEIMCRDVVTVPTEETVQTAIDVMAAFGISSVVVADSGQVKGVLTERDVLKKVASLERDPATIPVIEVMSSPVFSVPSNYSAFCASRMMDQTHVHRLVVLDDDHLVGIVTQTDIFRAAQRRLQAGEERALQLLDHSKTSVYVLDPEGRVVYLNPAFADLMQIDDPVSLIDQPFLEDRFWVEPQARAGFMERLREGDVQIDNLRLKTARGNALCVDVVSDFLRDVHGRVSAIHGVFHDVTGQRLAEEASALACKRLEQVNRELTQMRTQMSQGEKLALISEWAAGVVQDLNRPVGRLEGNLEAIRKYICYLREFVALSDELMTLVEPMEQPGLKAKLAQIQDRRRIMKTGFILEDVQSLCDESKEGIDRVVTIVRNLQDLSRTNTGNRLDE